MELLLGLLLGISAIAIGHVVAFFAEDDTRSLRYTIISTGAMLAVTAVYAAGILLVL